MSVLRPVPPPDANFVYRGDGDEVADLECTVDDNETRTHWLPTAEDIGQLQQGGRIQVTLWGHPINPLAVEVVPPDAES